MRLEDPPNHRDPMQATRSARYAPGSESMELQQTALFLGAAVVAVPVFKRLGLGSVLGYLAAGAIIGPSVLGFVDEVEQTLHVAELGVVLLLFIIGLELQPARLWSMRKMVFGLGGAQVVATGFILSLGAYAVGLEPSAAAIVGAALALSSTAFVLQVLSEKSELTSVHGRAAFGILLFQDLAAIPLLAVIPLMGTAHDPATEANPLWRMLLVSGVLVAVVLSSRFLLRPAFRVVASARNHELSTAWALLVVIATALAMQLVGLSMELGAFLAGVLLADSEYRHELEANIEPFKGLLLGLFFMAVGMSADLSVVLQQPGTVFAAVLALTATKFAVLVTLGRLQRQSAESSVSLGVALSQGGEFAFVIFGAAAAVGVLERGTVQLLVVVVTLSMIVTPLLFLARDRWIRMRRGRDSRPFDALEDAKGPVIIAGFGRYGQIVARVLRTKRIPFTALEVSAAQVDFVRKFGNKIYYGDASRPDLLRAAKAEEARAFVLAIDDMEASLRTARVVREHFPSLPVLARARNRDHAHGLRALGVHHIQRETLLSSLDTVRATLETLGCSTAEACEAVRRFREIDERALSEQYEIRHDQQALIASAKKVAEDLERLFEGDQKA